MKKVAFILFAALFVCLKSFSQTATSAIKGKVIDSLTKEPVFGVVVTARMDSGEVSGAHTDLNGDFVIKPLKAGKYSLTVNYTGYNKLEVKTEALKDKTTNVRLVLLPAAGHH